MLDPPVPVKSYLLERNINITFGLAFHSPEFCGSKYDPTNGCLEIFLVVPVESWPIPPVYNLYSGLLLVITIAYSSGDKYTGESNVKVVCVVVLLDAAFATDDVWISSEFIVTSENGNIIELLGNPFTIGRICTVTGSQVSLALNQRVTSLRNIPIGYVLGSITTDCAIGLIQLDWDVCREVVSVTISSLPMDSLRRIGSLVEIKSFSRFCSNPLALKVDSATVVVESNSLFAWSVILTILSPLLNVPAGISISPEISPWSLVCILDTLLTRIPLVLAEIDPIVPLAEEDKPVITFAAANPIPEFDILLFCKVTGDPKVALEFPLMSVIKSEATLATVLEVILKIALLFAESLISSPSWNAPLAPVRDNFLAGSVLALISVPPIQTYTLARGFNPLEEKDILWERTYGTTLISSLRLPTVLTIDSTGSSDWIPNLDLLWLISLVLLVLVTTLPELATAAVGSGLTCLPVQFTDQSSHCAPNPFLPSFELNVQLSWCPSRFVVTSGRVVSSNHVSEGGSSFIDPIKFTILNGFGAAILLVRGCSINTLFVYGNVTKSPVFTVLLLVEES